MPHLQQTFEAAVANSKNLSERPDNMTLLKLYALYKQATAGDATGERPGMLDFKGRAKYDAWAGKRGGTKDASMQSYVALVEKLAAKYA